MDCKIVVRYKFAKNSWTEVFYSAGNSNLVQALDRFDVIKTEALNVRQTGTVLLGATASDLADPRAALPRRFNLTRGAIPDSSPDITAVAARCSLTASNGKSRKIWLRGLNDEWTLRDAAGNDIPAATLKTKINAYIAGMVSSSLGIRYVSSVITNPWILAGAALRTLIGGRYWLRINVAGDMTGLAGSQVYLSGFPQTSLGGAKGIFQVLSAGDGFIVVNYPWTLPDITLTLTGSRFRKIGYLISNITGGQFEELTTHDTGGSIGRPRGRRRGLRIRQSLPVAG